MTKKKQFKNTSHFPWANLGFSIIAATVIIWAVATTVKSNPPDDYENENLLGETVSSSGAKYGIIGQNKNAANSTGNDQNNQSTSSNLQNSSTANLIQDNQILIPVGNSSNSLSKPGDIQGGAATNTANTTNIQGNSSNLQDAYRINAGDLDNLNL